MSNDLNNPGADASGLWAGGLPDAATFWSDACGIVTAKKYSAADALAFLDQTRSLCDSVFPGAYALPPSPSGHPAGLQMAQFADWSAWLLADMYLADAQPQGNGLAACFAQLSKLTNATTVPLRLDAAVDVARLAVAWYGNLTLFPSPIPSLPSQSNTGEAMQIVEQGLNVSGLLAMAMPGIGPAVGAGLQAASALLHIFFPGPNAASQEIAAITKAVTIELVNQEVSDAKGQIDTQAASLVNLYNELNALAQQSISIADLQPWLVEHVQNLLPTALEQTDTSINTLIDHVTAPGVIEVLAYGISTYLALCRQQVVTDTTLASIQQQTNPDDLQAFLKTVVTAIADLETFREAVAGVPLSSGGSQSTSANWACQFNNYLMQVAANRLSQIQVDMPPGLPIGQVRDEGSPKGTAPADGKITVPPNTPQASSAGVQRQLFVQQIFAPYVASVAVALDTAYEPHFDCIAQWTSSIAGWAQSLPTIAPNWAPAVTGWGGSSPQGTVWTDGTQVRYAACYANEQGVSAPGPWSNPITVAGQAHPTLQLTPDAVGSATRYWILRQVWPPGGSGWYGVVYVGAPEISVTSFQDTDDSRMGSSTPAPVARPA